MRNKIHFVALILATLFISSSCGETHGRYVTPETIWMGQYVYDDDLTITHEHMLNAMFGDTWTVLTIEEKFDEAIYPPKPDMPGRNPRTYLLTTIEFLDGNGDARTVLLHNRGGIVSQTMYNMRRWIADYYREFIDEYFQDYPVLIRARVSGNTAGRGLASHRHDELRLLHEHWRLQATTGGAVRLNEMTPANVFEMYPLYLSVFIRIDGETAHTQEVEESIFRQVDSMIDSMIAYTNNSLNARFFINYRNRDISFSSGNDPRWDVVQGEHGNYGNDFGQQVFYSYKGIFW